MTYREIISGGSSKTCEYDYRNRLTKITNRNGSGVITSTAEYVYDAFNRRIERICDSNGATTGGVTSQFYVYDKTDVILDFYDKDGPGETYSPVVWNRWLWNPQVEDQLLAQEFNYNTSGTFLELWWALSDRLASICEFERQDNGVTFSAGAMLHAERGHV